MAGNANSGGAKAKPFRDALRIELAAAGEDSKALRSIARKLIDAASSGDLQAIKELADRIDGKVAQAIIGGEDGDPPVKITRIEIVAAGGNGPG
jgi:hypothetical protein